MLRPNKNGPFDGPFLLSVARMIVVAAAQSLCGLRHAYRLAVPAAVVSADIGFLAVEANGLNRLALPESAEFEVN
ncbi:hypothetical protein J8I26_10540 [Herbaspirillum sp. LeCh32-8]|uniref:hypothetical protein n=1 Tax=Herbaspirillum sp. LeCh32-8 TaxID=2821356 RepID=UPI001AEB65C6|nr:hypothetical protein [Herbaspirillum sp. LeCh32-8]MBP0598543.1 hypothetical protein [Herbaspirillum sp. LeCh32-8]